MKKPSKKSLTKKNKPHQGWTYNRDVDEQKALFLQPGLRPDDNDMVSLHLFRRSWDDSSCDTLCFSAHRSTSRSGQRSQASSSTSERSSRLCGSTSSGRTYPTANVSPPPPFPLDSLI